MRAQPTNSRIRILVVEDHDPFRRHICSLVDSHSHFQIIGTSGDGAKAVPLAKEVQPDIILLDIGLPGINGLEAARQISKVASQAKIIFLTQETSAEVVEEALFLGAWGYVLKASAGSELVAAIEAVSRGQQFLSCGLEAYAVCLRKALAISRHMSRCEMRIRSASLSKRYSHACSAKSSSLAPF